MIRFIQYPRNSVENLNRALYIKLLKIQWWSGSKIIPFPAWGREDENFRKSHGMKIYKNETLHYYFIYDFFCFFYYKYSFVFQLFLFSNRNTRRHPEPRIPPASRSVQILYRISGMLNESNHSHIGDDTSHVFTTLAQMGIVNARLIFMND